MTGPDTNDHTPWIGSGSGTEQQGASLPYGPGTLGALAGTGTVYDRGVYSCETVPIQWVFSPVPDDAIDDPCRVAGSDIACQNQTLGESVPIAGTPFFLRYQSDRALGRAGADATAINDARGIGGWTLNVHHALDRNVERYGGTNGNPGFFTVAKGLFMGDGRARSAAKMQAPVPIGQKVYVTAEDGGEVYAFDSFSGQHLQTLQSDTGAAVYSFGYDAAGALTTVTDASGNVTTIQRDGDEHPTAIVSPFGQTTSLTVDANGYLSGIRDPAGRSVQPSADAGGLLTSLTDANSNVHKFRYDGFGRLLSDVNPAGGSTTLARTDKSSGYSVERTSALGQAATYGVEFSSDASSTTQKMTNTWPGGLVATKTDTQKSDELSEATSLPDGTTTATIFGPDPRWGIQAPIANTSTVTTPGGLRRQMSTARAVTLGDPGNPLSLQTQTDTIVVNGRTYTRAYASSTQTVTTTSPAGRQSATTLDNLGRVVKVAPPGLAPIQFSYDPQGHVTGIAQDTRVSMFSYDSQGFLVSTTDPLSNVTAFTRDADGRVTVELLADGASVGFSYDPAGNLTSLTPPGRPAHGFAYTPIDLVASYQPPALAGVPSVSTSYTYDLDGQLTQWSRPDGMAPRLTYDTAGRVTALTISEGTLGRTYDSAGRVATMTDASRGSISYGYDGPLVTSETFSGAVQGGLARTYDSDFRVTSTTVDGANSASFGYDPDGLLVQAGPLGLTRDPQTGFVSATSAGGVTTTESRSSFGEVAGWSAAAGGNALYSATLARDLDGRLTGKNETMGGATTALTYAYDARGRLTDVSSNGNAVAHYGYDSNGNRTSFTGPAGTVSGTYDDQDRLLSYGAATYGYGANGELQSKTDPSGTTNYLYDALGNLRSTTLPDGTAIGYVIDARNRRVGKTVNGTLVQGLLYEGQLRPVAELDASNKVVSRFVYATRLNVPDIMVKSGVAYRVLTDLVGSVRLVVSTVDGSIAERIDYDEFGNVTRDTAPGFQPFGFAGGLYDRDTKLVRFGARDYDASVGRWTSQDPIRFAGGTSNLYEYADANPISLIDPAGRSESQGPGESENVWNNLGESILQFAAVQGLLEVSAANVIAQVAATFSESILGYVRLADLASGQRLSRGTDFETGGTMWERVQCGFNKVYKSEWRHLFPRTKEDDIADTLRMLDDIQRTIDSPNPFDLQQQNPGYADP
ncbi:MAG TPA: RHS repeat-associated core domain-containing protein [Polyangiaceae bacterium]|nr:RHS repeat-associated core domain-containing protein [Polyangiaceae bacterium]